MTGTGTRDALAELVVLTAYDEHRQSLGHDYGCGQRGAELSRRRRELRSAGSDPYSLRELGLTDDEYRAAFERVGKPRMHRAKLDAARYGSYGATRTYVAWRRVARVYAPELVAVPA